ncbi:MAG: helix-turn-helix domain-containing protein [Rhizobacter sp.]
MSKTSTPEKQALARAVEVAGGQAALASALGFSDPRRVWPWFMAERRVPAEHCPAIERVTKERGAPVFCEELRPDIPWDVLREQTSTVLGG